MTDIPKADISVDETETSITLYNQITYVPYGQGSKRELRSVECHIYNAEFKGEKLVGVQIQKSGRAKQISKYAYDFTNSVWFPHQDGDKNESGCCSCILLIIGLFVVFIIIILLFGPT